MALLSTSAPVHANAVLAGRARAVDGDTLVIDTGVQGGARVRFYGMDAPESAQLCRNAAGKEYQVSGALPLNRRLRTAKRDRPGGTAPTYAHTYARCAASSCWLAHQGACSCPIPFHRSP